MISNLVIFLILSCEDPIDFHDKILNVLVKNLKYFLHEKYNRLFLMFLKKYISCLLRILYQFIKSFADPFVGFA